MKAYITKYALTQGIMVADGEEDGNAFFYGDRRSNGCSDYAHGRGREYAFDAAETIAIAELMRVRKIASLKKQIARLEKMTFSGFEG